MSSLTRRALLVSATALTLPVAPWAKSERLTLAFIPQENPEKLVGDIEAISAWLSERIGAPVEGFVTFDHAAAVEALRNGDADISFMGALFLPLPS
jgi:phosphonate transport system substrate-binding protein